MEEKIPDPANLLALGDTKMTPDSLGSLLKPHSQEKEILTWGSRILKTERVKESVGQKRRDPTGEQMGEKPKHALVALKVKRKKVNK